MNSRLLSLIIDRIGLPAYFLLCVTLVEPSVLYILIGSLHLLA